MGGRATTAAAACLVVLATGSARADDSRVHDAILRDVPRAYGTVVLVHGGGWSGPNQRHQWNLDWWPGSLFRAARWNTATIDYAAGKAGLDSVAGEVRAALDRAPRQTVCVYGESSGGHLALLTAAWIPQVRCVIGLGTPTDLERWREDATREGDAGSLATYAETAGWTFGMGEIEDEWQPVAQAGCIPARVLLAGQDDDEALPIAGQLAAFDGVHPATDVLTLQPGGQRYLHGSLSAASRARFETRMASLLWSARHRRPRSAGCPARSARSGR
jgi:acetyl esterase/lipase